MLNKISSFFKSFKDKPSDKEVGYLPDDRPAFLKMLVFAIQQFLVMLPATVLAALLMNFNVPTAIFASGVATLAFLLITKGKIPLYYGSSFAYIPAVSIVIDSVGKSRALSDGLIIPEVMGSIQLAIILSGVLSVLAGIAVRFFGQNAIEKVLPPHVTGPVACIIGLSLAGSALNGAFAFNKESGMLEWQSLVISLATLLSIIILTVVLRKKFISQIPILLGIAFGFLLTLIIKPSLIDLESNQKTGLELLDWTIFSTFGVMDTALIPVALLAIVPVALVTIPESSAHIYQLDLYVNDLAKKKGEKTYDIKDRLGQNLIGDGIGDVIATSLGGPAGTNYGENISTSSVTRNFSVWVFAFTAILAILFAFTPAAAFTDFLPAPVINGASIYLFGVIAAQGITLMIEKKVDMFNPKILAIIAVIFIIGLGGHYGAFGNDFQLHQGFPLYSVDGQIVYFPALAVAAIAGILLNLLLNFVERLVKKTHKA